jgi:hypothetical protein
MECGRLPTPVDGTARPKRPEFSKEENDMKKLMIALASATALLASSAMAQEKLKIGAAPYGLNAEFMQIWSAALEEHPAV